MAPAAITGPIGSAVEHGRGLSYVWKYRNRLFFIETDSMNAWYLNIDSVWRRVAANPAGRVRDPRR